MVDKIWHVIGLMSGTSLDGVDLAYVKISRKRGYHFEILKTKSIDYSEIWKKRLSNAFTYSGEKLIKINSDYGLFLGELAADFIEENSIKNLNFIASHGHTIFHDPGKNYTLQIGSGAHLASKSGAKVICDFRVQDVALGGQGAPLVPVGDQLLFSEYDFCLNIGGFANVSFDDNEERIAYDICPANIVLNHFTRPAGLEYDDKGRIASKGKIDQDLLTKLNDLEFYDQQQPKSLGYEFIADTILPIFADFKLSLSDKLRTFVEHIALQISLSINEYSANFDKEELKVLITGGGAFNDFMIARIKEHTNAMVVIPSREIIEFKEALLFAFLGVLRDQEENNCLKSVTGAVKDHSSGVIYKL
ncbi:MAG: anhydro-N-acetylmuramic acid kinase [Flavobacteriales bacterium]|nr:anhydro-N-acetylmuramic acid kinase [Flavobacteriales bacterium]